MLLLQIAVVTADDDFLRFAVDARGDGPVSVWLMPDIGPRVRDNRLSGIWRDTDDGYRVANRESDDGMEQRLSSQICLGRNFILYRAVLGPLLAGRYTDGYTSGTIILESPAICATFENVPLWAWDR